MRKIICLFSLLLVAATANAQNSTYQDKDTEWLKKSIAEQKKREDAEANRLKKALKLDALEKDKKDDDVCWGENKADGSSVRTCR